MTSKKEQIQSKALEIIRNNHQGIRYSELVNSIKEIFPDIPKNTICGSVWNLDKIMPKEVYKADRGLFRNISFKDEEIVTDISISKQTKSLISEDNFYQPFADYLTNDLEECTKAIELGKNKFKDKWGTPDVIGIKKSECDDIVKFNEIIVSAEIKIDTNGLITAFGQACAYKIFSHKVYIVVPKNSSEEDKSRIESLCLIFGIGLILFDANNVINPQFEIRVRPAKHDPDSFYVNKYMKEIKSELFN